MLWTKAYGAKASYNQVLLILPFIIMLKINALDTELLFNTMHSTDCNGFLLCMYIEACSLQACNALDMCVGECLCSSVQLCTAEPISPKCFMKSFTVNVPCTSVNGGWYHKQQWQNLGKMNSSNIRDQKPTELYIPWIGKCMPYPKYFAGLVPNNWAGSGWEDNVH